MTIVTAEVTLSKVIEWINKTNSFHSLQKIRSKTNKRLKYWFCHHEESPFKDIPIEKKREILRDLIV